MSHYLPPMAVSRIRIWGAPYFEEMWEKRRTRSTSARLHRRAVTLPIFTFPLVQS